MSSSKKISYQLQFSDGHSAIATDPDDEYSDDDNDFSYGLHAVSSAKPKREIVTLYHSGTKKYHTLFTNAFVWNYTWLEVTIVTEASNCDLGYVLNNKLFSVMKYRITDSTGVSPFAVFLESVHKDLRDDSLEEKKSKSGKSGRDSDTPLNGITTTDLQAFQIAKGSFLDFLRSHSNGNGGLKLLNFVQVLNQFSSSGIEESQLSALNIKKMVEATSSGSVLMSSVHAPHFFELGPMLFPRKIVNIMQKTSESANSKSEKAQLQGLLDCIIENEPWQLGFSEVIFKLSKTLGRRWSGLEAGLKQMKMAPFYLHKLSYVQKDALHVYDLIKDLCRRDGHTYLTFFNIKKSFDHFNTKKYNHFISSFDAAISFLEDESILFKDDQSRYHLMSFKRAEDKIVSCIKSILKKAKDSDLQIDFESDNFARIRQDPDQLKAAQMISKNPITIISGRGGTGKTEVVVTVLNAIDEKLNELNTSLDDTVKEDFDPNSSKITAKLNNSATQADPSLNGRILFTAPTGKAAAVMRKRSGRKAFTMHQILASHKNFNRSEGRRWKFADTKVLAVDESSMVSLELFSYLINCLTIGANLIKVVLLGDVLQLPSIDPGNFMDDMFMSLQKSSCAVELTTNHRSEGSIIFDNASKISRREEPLFDKAKGFHLLTTDDISSLPPHVRRGAENSPPVTRQSHFIPLKKNVDREKLSLEKEHLYLGLLRHQLQAYDLVDVKKSQFIAFRRAECQVVNEFCCKVYNNHLMYLEGTGKRNFPYFAVGDKIMSTRNSDVSLLVPQEEINEDDFINCKKDLSGETGILKKPPEKDFMIDSSHFQLVTDRLMNGNVYTIESIRELHQRSLNDENPPPPICYFELDDLTGEIIRPIRFEFERFCKPSHAWALTIHKFQGSEADTVVYGVSDSKMENWQHVYTAVTRGKKRVIIVGRWKDLIATIKRNPRQRQTTLGEKVSELFEAGDMSSDEELEKAMSNVSYDSLCLTQKSTVCRASENCLFANDESFEMGLSQMNDHDFSNFTQESKKDETFDEEFDTFIASQVDLNGSLLGDSQAPSRRCHPPEFNESTLEESPFATPKKSKSGVPPNEPKTPNISAKMRSKLKFSD